MSTVVKAKMNTIVNRFEDPMETLEYSYQKQIELLQNVRRGVAEVATSKKRLELQRARLQMNMDQFDAQAKQAVTQDREDLARMTLERKTALKIQADVLNRQILDLNDQQQKLQAAETRLATKVESFRAKKEIIKAQYSAAEAQVKVTESVTGISEEMADVGMAVQRAEDKTEQMKARSAALDELLAGGTLTDYSGGSEIERLLQEAKAKGDVDVELARLKAKAGK
jgi:phage shock protein A